MSETNVKANLTARTNAAKPEGPRHVGWAGEGRREVWLCASRAEAQAEAIRECEAIGRHDACTFVGAGEDFAAYGTASGPVYVTQARLDDIMLNAKTWVAKPEAFFRMRSGLGRHPPETSGNAGEGQHDIAVGDIVTQDNNPGSGRLWEVVRVQGNVVSLEAADPDDSTRASSFADRVTVARVDQGTGQSCGRCSRSVDLRDDCPHCRAQLGPVVLLPTHEPVAVADDAERALATHREAIAGAAGPSGLGFWGSPPPPPDDRSTDLLTIDDAGRPHLHVRESETHTGLLTGVKARDQLRACYGLTGKLSAEPDVAFWKCAFRCVVLDAEWRIVDGWPAASQVPAIEAAFHEWQVALCRAADEGAR